LSGSHRAMSSFPRLTATGPCYRGIRTGGILHLKRRSQTGLI
jgi:hypothetical protein